MKLWKWKDEFYLNIITIKYYSHILKVNRHVIFYLKFDFIMWVTHNTLLSSKSVLYTTHVIKSTTNIVGRLTLKVCVNITIFTKLVNVNITFMKSAKLILPSTFIHRVEMWRNCLGSSSCYCARAYKWWLIYM